MITVKDIAKLSGVSATTVSRVINNSGYVSTKTRRKVEEVLKGLDYQPNELARSLVRRATRTIALVLPNIGTPFFSGLTRGVEEVLNGAGYNLIICHSGEDPQREEAYIDTLQQNRVSGILITPATSTNRRLADAVKNKYPVVVLARKVENIAIDSVTADNTGGSFSCIEHLVQLGHQRIGVINGPQNMGTGKDRWKGAKNAMQTMGVEIEDGLIRFGDFTIQGGYKETVELINLPKPPTAIFVANNMMSAGVLRALRDHNLRVPEDISIVAFDGFEDSDYGFLISPQITSNIHPTTEMGRVGAKLLLDRIEAKKEDSSFYSPQEIKLKLEFVLRKSCRSIVSTESSPLDSNG